MRPDFLPAHLRAGARWRWRRTTSPAPRSTCASCSPPTATTPRRWSIWASPTRAWASSTRRCRRTTPPRSSSPSIAAITLNRGIIVGLKGEPEKAIEMFKQYILLRGGEANVPAGRERRQAHQGAGGGDPAAHRRQEGRRGGHEDGGGGQEGRRRGRGRREGAEGRGAQAAAGRGEGWRRQGRASRTRPRTARTPRAPQAKPAGAEEGGEEGCLPRPPPLRQRRRRLRQRPRPPRRTRTSRRTRPSGTRRHGEASEGIHRPGDPMVRRLVVMLLVAAPASPSRSPRRSPRRRSHPRRRT